MLHKRYSRVKSWVIRRHYNISFSLRSHSSSHVLSISFHRQQHKRMCYIKFTYQCAAHLDFRSRKIWRNLVSQGKRNKAFEIWNTGYPVSLPEIMHMSSILSPLTQNTNALAILFIVVCSLFDLQCPEQRLAHRKHSTHICYWISELMMTPVTCSQRTQSSFLHGKQCTTWTVLTVGNSGLHYGIRFSLGKSLP